MAYRNLINVSGLTEAAVFRHVKDWLTSRNGIADYSSTGLGWSLYDSSFAVDADTPTVGDWVVIRSTGENGQRSLYYRILYSTLANSILRTSSGVSWNADTNAWVGQMYGGDHAAGPTSGSSFNVSIYGDLDAFTIIVGNGTAFSFRFFGNLVDTLHDPTIATAAGAISAGSNVVVTVDAVPASWASGKALYLRHESGIERVVIGSIAGSDVTLGTVANSYAAGARLARDYSVAMTATNNNLIKFRTLISRSGTLSPSGDLSAQDLTTTINDADPDQLNSVHVTAYLPVSSAVSSTVGYYGRLPNILRVSVTGITSANVYTDDATGASWRAFVLSTYMYLMREV